VIIQVAGTSCHGDLHAMRSCHLAGDHLAGWSEQNA
jgi:hypothetical protein